MDRHLVRAQSCDRMYPICSGEGKGRRQSAWPSAEMAPAAATPTLVPVLMPDRAVGRSTLLTLRCTASLKGVQARPALEEAMKTPIVKTVTFEARATIPRPKLEALKPGLEKSNSTLFKYARWSSNRPAHSGPESTRMLRGFPLSRANRSTLSMTWLARKFGLSTIARNSAVRHEIHSLPEAHCSACSTFGDSKHFLIMPDTFAATDRLHHFFSAHPEISLSNVRFATRRFYVPFSFSLRKRLQKTPTLCYSRGRPQSIVASRCTPPA